MSGQQRVTVHKIAAGQSVGEAAMQRAGDLRSILTPAGFQGTYVSFLAGESPDGDFFAVHDGANNEALVGVEAGVFNAIPHDVRELLRGVAWLKIRAGSSVAPVAQAADRTLRITLGGV